MSHRAEDVPPQPSDQNQWDRIAGSEQFNDLLQLKKTFIVPAFIFFLVYYFALAVLVGYAPKLASTRVKGIERLALSRLEQHHLDAATSQFVCPRSTTGTSTDDYNRAFVFEIDFRHRCTVPLSIGLLFRNDLAILSDSVEDGPTGPFPCTSAHPWPR